MKLNKKLIIMLASVIGVVVVLIIVIMLFVGGGSKVISYDKIEEKMITAAESYYEDNESKLPKSGTEILSVDTLVDNGYLNELSKYTDEDVTCDGQVYVTKNPSGYAYRASLDCGNDYNTKTLSDVVTENVVTSGSGLYKVEQVNSTDQSKTISLYAFRGDNVSNYVQIGDYNWEIIKVYENGEIAILGDSSFLRTVWDDRFNLNTDSYNGINDYLVSRIRDEIDTNVVNVKDDYLTVKNLITTHTACVGKRTLDDTSKDGSTECAETLDEQYFSMLPVYDFMNASLDANCNKAEDDSCFNYNFLASSNDEWWTITGVADNTEDVFFVESTLNHEYARRNRNVRLYAHLDAGVTYVSGTGTYEDPYIVK